VEKFLVAQAKKTSNYVKSPIWSIVNGPWKLATFTNTGLVRFTRNPRYSGPSKNQVQTFSEVPFTSESAEFNQLLSSRGSTSVSGQNATDQLSVGYIPPTSLSQSSRVAGNGYKLLTQYGFGFGFFVINMQNKKVGPILSQLYVRQALQHLVDQPTWIKAFLGGVGVPVYGPVPLKPSNPYLGKHKQTNLYPFSISAAKRLLAAHGWNVHPGGKTTCGNPAKCGKGIKRGQALTFSLLYTSGDTALGQMMSSFASNADKVGIKVQLSSGPFSQVTGAVVPICKPGDASTHCAWQMLDWGGWYYNAYPSGEQLYATGANGNYGGWDNKTTNRLIERVKTAPASQAADALFAYDRNIARNLPGMIFMPFPATRVAAATELKGYAPSPFGLLDPENW
jgi:peptide/nickel transport system substrate-binding protein